MSTGKGAAALDGATRGVVGAMAMTGMRRVSTGLGLLEKPPPDTMAEQAPVLPGLLARLPPDLREEAIELAHWGYGAAGGVGYSLLPSGLRRRRWSGPAYGLAIWVAFEAGIVPLLGLKHAQRRTVVTRLLVAADHVLYGAAVGGSPWRPRV